MKIREIGKWYCLLNKRLLKRMEFIIILVALPLLIFAVSVGARQEKGVLHILLLTSEDADEEAEELVDFITKEESIIRFSISDDEFKAKQMLIKQEADAIWVIPNDLEKKIAEYVKNKRSFITVFQSKNSTILNLSKEKLYQVLYPKIALFEYLDFMKKKIQTREGQEELSPEKMEELLVYHKKVDANTDFLEFLAIDGGKEVGETKRVDYLLSPMRGILGIWLFVAIIVANIYYLRDEKNGLFDFVDRRKRMVLGLIYKFSVSVNLLILMNITLFITDQMGMWSKEAIASLFLFFSLLLIGEILITVFPSEYILGALLFPMSVYLIVSSPIFLDIRLGGMKFLSWMNPISHYLGLSFDSSYFKDFAFYIAICFILLLFLRLFKKEILWK